MANPGRNSRAPCQIVANEDNAAVDFGRAKFEPNVTAAPVAESFDQGGVCDRTLISYRASQLMPVIRDERKERLLQARRDRP